MTLSDLSPAQQRIVRLRARGFSTRQIAKMIGSSPHTVRTHNHLISIAVLGEERYGDPANNFVQVLVKLFDFVEKTDGK